MKKFRLVVFLFIIISALAWGFTIYGWMKTEPGFEPIHTFISAILSSLFTILGWLESKKVVKNQEVDLSGELAVNFFAIEETAYFTNQPGIYSDRMRFSITNNLNVSVKSFKIIFIFPKLEKYINEKQFPRFEKRENHTDFEIHEEDNCYRITFDSESQLYRGDPFESDRDFLRYTINLPNKKKWKKSVLNSDETISWQVFTNVTEKYQGTQNIQEIYVGKQKRFFMK
jgi:hypothetical protein